MSSIHVAGHIVPLLAVAAVLVSDATRAAEATAPAPWTVSPDFEKGNDARTNLSGAACSPLSSYTFCLIANDEKKYAQFFTIGNQTLQPTVVIRLLPDDVEGVDMDEIDAEAVAVSEAGATPAYFYVAGSHGLSRNSDEFRPSQFYTFRFPIGSDGKPAFEASDDSVSDKIERSCGLGDLIAADEVLGRFHGKKLSDNGANIEGMAAKGDNLYFGFRGPSENGNAFILRVAEARLFSHSCEVPEAPGVPHAESNAGSETEKPAAQRFAIPLGDGIGIRDLVAVSDGFLILTGVTADASSPADIVFWDGEEIAEGSEGEHLNSLYHLEEKQDAKAEALVLLDPSAAPDYYRLLVMFDGPENGDPTYIEAPKPET